MSAVGGISSGSTAAVQHMAAPKQPAPVKGNDGDADDAPAAAAAAPAKLATSGPGQLVNKLA